MGHTGGAMFPSPHLKLSRIAAPHSFQLLVIVWTLLRCELAVFIFCFFLSHQTLLGYSSSNVLFPRFRALFVSGFRYHPLPQSFITIWLWGMCVLCPRNISQVLFHRNTVIEHFFRWFDWRDDVISQPLNFRNRFSAMASCEFISPSIILRHIQRAFSQSFAITSMIT